MTSTVILVKLRLLFGGHLRATLLIWLALQWVTVLTVIAWTRG